MTRVYLSRHMNWDEFTELSYSSTAVVYSTIQSSSDNSLSYPK